MTKPQVGAWVRSRREALKLGVGDVTGPGRLSRQTWYDLEADRHPPTTSTQRKVADALGVAPDWYDRLLEGEEPQISSPDPPPDGWVPLERFVALHEEVTRLAGEVRVLGAAVERLTRQERRDGL